MVDARFYRSVGERRISELLATTGHGDLWAGDGLADRAVCGVSELETAGPKDIGFAASDGFVEALRTTGAGVVLHASGLGAHLPAGATGIPCGPVQIVFSELSGALYPDALQPWATGVGPAPALEEQVRLGAHVSLGAGVEIGAGTVIGDNTSIGPGVTVGRGCVIGANCSVQYTCMGDGVVILPGARLGTSGFGYLPHRGTIVPVPQLGRTILQDRVEIGANSVIDRGALGDTVVGEGTKIGNLVVVAHNCRIGRNCMLVGFIGLAGSVTIEDGVIMGGSAGIAGHVTIGTGSTIRAGSLVAKSFPAGSQITGGLPAEDFASHARTVAAVLRLARGDRN